MPVLGHVYVRTMLLRERLDVVTFEGPPLSRIARMLAIMVNDHDRQPVLDADGWEMYGGKYFDETLAVWNLCRKVSKLEETEAKKS
jgi:hypothetical protein